MTPINPSLYLNKTIFIHTDACWIVMPIQTAMLVDESIMLPVWKDLWQVNGNNWEMWDSVQPQ